MTQDLHQHAEVIFNEAIERPTVNRSAFLDNACGTDAALRDEVESLIAHYESTEVFLSSPASASHEISTGPDDALNLSITGDGPGGLIGSYRILQLLKEDDLGTIYLVEQDEPPQRLCLDLYAPTGAHKDIGLQFQYLGEQLEALEHPGITRIHETGTANTGKGQQHFVVADYIDGISLIESIHRHPPSHEDRITLVRELCDIVMYAHCHGVVHGDLRPGTIFISEDGQIHVIDFGIAMALDLNHSLASSLDVGNVVSADLFRSPESFDGTLDTRSDVYALGVLLYQLVTGHMPWKVDGSTPNSVRDAIISGTPVPPSNWEPRAHGELEAVISKAMALNPDDRYQSPDELDRDLERIQNGLPVEACPATFLGSCRRLAQLHPTPTWTAAIIIGLLVILAFVMTIIVASGGEDASPAINSNDAATSPAPGSE